MACTLWTTSTLASTIYHLNLHFDAFHYATTRISGKTPVTSSSRPIHKGDQFVALHQNATAKNAADTFLAELWKLRRLLTQIISEMDSKFSAKFSPSLGKMLRVKQPLSMAYLLQAKGQTQTTKQVLERYLQTLVHYHWNDLYQPLPLAEHAYTNSAMNAYKMTLFWSYYGFNPQTGCIKNRAAHMAGVTIYKHWMQDMHQQAKQTLENS